MTATDYRSLARTYDQDRVRTEVPTDEVLAALVAGAGGAPVRVLDVGCGTGSYLKAQAEAFAAGAVALFGIDTSPEMLERAGAKVDADLRVGTAEALPYQDAVFDHVVTRFAFHHFPDKPGALDELRRVLRPGGRLRLENICPEHMARWWVFQAFPDCAGIDAGRFWDVSTLVKALEARGLAPEARVETVVTRRPWAALLETARRRDVSELALLPDAAFQAGIAGIEQTVARDPAATCLDEVAVLHLGATVPQGG